MYNVAKRKGHGNSFPLFCIKNLLTSSLANFSASTAHDVSFNTSAKEEEHSNSPDSSDSLTPIDRCLKLNSGSCYLPHPDKEKSGGEDAHFICGDEQAIGVADGVGGWVGLGIDSGKYLVNDIQSEPKGSINPARVLEKVYNQTRVKGSSTACIIALTNQVAPGDVVIAGTDGLFDNLYNNGITSVGVYAERAGFDPQNIVELAGQRAQDKNRQTPP